MASAPAMTVTDRVPAAMSAAARFTSHCGELPPTVVISHTPGWVPNARASSVAGAGPLWVMMLTTESRSIRWRRSGTSVNASSQARAIRSMGVTGSPRSMDSPEATITGIRSASCSEMVIGAGDSRREGRTFRVSWSEAEAITVPGRSAFPPAGVPTVTGSCEAGAMTPGPGPTPPEGGDRAGGILPEGFHFGVATAGFQVEGGFNGPGEPGNNWLRWEQVGRVEPSGNAVGFWDRPEEALDRAAGLGCDSFRLGLEWARVEPRPGEVDDRALAGYGEIIDGCIQRGLEPLVTLHHFTHPSWLGEDFWLRPDAPERFLAWVELVLAALAGQGAAVGHHQRDQRAGHRIVAAGVVPARALPGLRRCRGGG